MPARPNNLETLSLSLELLKRIPRSRKVDSGELHAQLKEAGYDRDLRSIQRQLETLCEHFDIEKDDQSRPYGYRWKEAAQGLSLPGLSEQESLLLSLAEQHLRNLLPASLMKSMDGFFEQARRNLSPATTQLSTKLAREWMKKVRVVATTLPMLPPKLAPDVFEQVSRALYNNHWLDITYTNAQGKTSQARVMPLGLAQQGVRLFMPCRFDSYQDTRNLALQRIKSATSTGLAFERPSDFDLQTYDDNGHFAYGKGVLAPVELWVAAGLKVLLEESPLSKDQQISPAPNGEDGFVVSATVVDSALLLWWVRSQGRGCRLLSPQNLVDRL
jgi:predicted DNA-binding transcriptional regulator YafY